MRQTGEGEKGEGQTGNGQTVNKQTGEGQTGEGQIGEGQTGEAKYRGGTGNHCIDLKFGGKKEYQLKNSISPV